MSDQNKATGIKIGDNIRNRIVVQAQNLIHEGVAHTKKVAKEAQNINGAHLYPIQGIYYFVTHPQLIRPFYSTLVTSVVSAAAIILATAFFGYLPQVALLAFIMGPFAFLGAAAAVIFESWLIVKFLFGSLFIKGMIGEEIFELVLQQRQKGYILSKSGHYNSTSLFQRINKAGKTLSFPSLVQYILTLPLAFIPFVGWIMFIWINAEKTAESYIRPYLTRGKIFTTDHQREEYMKTYRAEFNGFGAVALLLEQIPIVGAAFQISNFVGAALWVEKLEDSRSAKTMIPQK